MPNRTTPRSFLECSGQNYSGVDFDALVSTARSGNISGAVLTLLSLLATYGPPSLRGKLEAAIEAGLALRFPIETPTEHDTQQAFDALCAAAAEADAEVEAEAEKLLALLEARDADYLWKLLREAIERGRELRRQRSSYRP